MVKATIDGETAEQERDGEDTAPAAQTEEGAEQEAEGEEDESPAIVVQIGDDEPEEDEAAKAPQWVRDLRKRTRDLERENRDLKAAQVGEARPAKLGPRPARADFDYDDDAYDAALEAWIADKAKVDAEQAESERRQKAQQEAWSAKLTRYNEGKQTIGVNDYDDAEAVVTDTFSVTQQGVMVQGAENPALLAYALGKNPKRAKELAAITDPIEFAFAIAKVEAQLTVTRRNSPPPPEKRVTGGSTGAGTGGDATLDKLRAEAAKTGDYSKVIAYKRQKRG